MKHISVLYNSRLAFCASVAAAVLFAPAARVRAASDTWTGGSSTGGNWTDPANWGGAAPSANDWLFFSGGSQTTANNDFPAGTIFNNLTFNNDASSFNLTGNLLVITNAYDTNGLSSGSGSITNFSSYDQTMSLPLTLSAGRHNLDTEYPSGVINIAGPFVRNTGGAVAFTVNGGNINFTGSGLANINNMLGGWATSGNFWAALDGSGNIIQYAGSVDVSSGIIPNDPTANVRYISDTANITAATGTMINSLFMAEGAARSLTVTNVMKLGSRGGIFRPGSASGVMTITGGFLTANGGGELTFSDGLFTATANNLVINSCITNDSPANPVTVNVMGYVAIGGTNTFTGGTFVDQGRVQGSSIGSFGLGPVYVFPGGEAFLNNNGTYTNNFFLSGNGTTETSGGQNLGAIRMNTGATTVAGTVTLLANSRISAGSAGSNIISGKITGHGRLEFTSSTGNMNSILLRNTNSINDWTGGLLLTAGGSSRQVYIKLGANNQIPDGTGTGDATINGASDTARLDLNGFSDTINGLIGALNANNQVANFGTNASILTFGANNATASFGGSISDGGFATNSLSVVKIGAGTQTLLGANTHVGTTTINGGTLLLETGSTITKSTNIILNAGGILDVSGILPLNLNPSQAVTFNGGTVAVGLVAGVNAITTPALTVSGATNFITVLSVPPISSYPQQFTILKATTVSGSLNFGLGAPLPVSPSVPYGGYISNNVANNSVDVVITAGPLAVRWAGYSSGSPNSSWDTTTPDWALFDNTPAPYSDGDFAIFNDAASNGVVTVSQTISPAGIIVSNSTLAYTFNDNGNYIAGLGGLTKEGPGSLVLDNGTPNTYAGDVLVSGGTLQVGGHDAAGSIPPTATIINNGALVFSRSDAAAVSNVITGTGTLTYNGGGTLTLAAPNIFTGAVSVAQGTLQVADNSALGTTNGFCTVANGATLDINGTPGTSNTRRLGNKQFFVSGSGVGNSGAIINSGGDTYPAMSFVTLQGSTTFGGPGRWDLRAPAGTAGDPATAKLSTGGSAFNLTKVGQNFFGLVSVTVDPTLADIDVQGGILDFEGNTTGLGNPNNTLTIESGASLFLYSPTNRLNKKIVLNDGASITNVAGTNVIVGPVTINGNTQFQIAGTNLSLNGLIAGSGSITKTLNSPLIINGDGSGFNGNVSVSAGSLVINGWLGGTLTIQGGGILSGIGTNVGVTDLSGGILPGAARVAGTFTTGGIIFEGSATNVFDLTTNTAIGGGTNDLIQVNGDLVANGNTIVINPLPGKLADGSYRLFNYTGALPNGINSFNPTVALVGGASRYVLTLDYSTTNQINLVVSGGPSVVEWNTTSGAAWDTFTSQNWSNETTHAFPDYFYAADTVVFDDAPGVVTTVGISGSVAPLSVTNNSSVNSFTLNGSGKITGTGSITKLGSSTLTIATANDFTGPVTIAGGVLSAGTGTALGATNGPTIITNGGTLDIGGQSLGLEPIFVSGTIVNNGVQAIHALRSVTMTGDSTFGGPGGAAPFVPPGPTDGVNRWDIRAASTGSTNEPGTFLSTGGLNFNLTKTGSNQMAFVSAAVDTNLGNIHIIGGMLEFELNTTGMGNPTNTCTVEPNGLVAFYNDPFPFNKVFVLNGDGAGMYNESSANTVIGSVKLVGSNVFNIAGTSLTLASNVISGSGSLNKIGGGALLISDTNTFTGSTLISTGRVALVGSSSLSNSPNITLGIGAILDVSTRTDGGLTLVGGQMLSGVGTIRGNLTNGVGATLSPGIGGVGILTVTNNVSLQGTTIMDIASGTNDLITGASTINYGGALNLVFTPGSLVAGNSFKLFGANSYAGSFATITPATPGANLAWDTSSLNSSGILGVKPPTNPNPTNITASVSGGNLSLSWPSDHLGWRLQAQTNSINTGLGTNWFDVVNTAGVTNISIPVNSAAGAIFYRLVY
jgi:autotransporter-associated beta strand protein